MDIKDLAKKVKDMRDAQKQYFKLRDAESLKKSKALETEVDKAVGAVIGGQVGLFGGAQEIERPEYPGSL